MVLKGFELSDDDELPDEQDPGQSAYEDNEYSDIAMLEPVQPPAPVQPKVMPTFDFHQCIDVHGILQCHVLMFMAFFKAFFDIDVHGILQGYEVCVLYEYAEYAEYV
jgi:hypothetical protein